MPQEPDTTNYFAVTVADMGIAILALSHRLITKEMALNLSAWLLVLSEAEREDFDALVTAIKNT